MEVARITHYSQLLEVRAAWNRLGANHPMLRWEWLANWWRLYSGRQQGHAQRLSVLVCREGEQIVGIAPWRLVRSPLKGRVLRFLGEDEVCTDYLTILHEPAAREAVARAMVDHLGEQPAGWDAIELEYVAEADPIVEAVMAEFAARGYGMTRPTQQGNFWQLPLPSSWEEYLMVLSKSHRKQLRRLSRAYLDSGLVHCRFAETAEDLAEMWPVLVDLHQRRRNTLGEPGCFAWSRFARFHLEMAQQLLHSGHLRLLVVYYQGRPIEADYNFCSDTATFAYQSGLDPEHADKQPGRLAMMHTIRRAIEEGHRTYDFMRGDEEYKRHWRAVSRPALEYRVANHCATARVRDATWRAARELKSIVKTGLGWVGGDGQNVGAPAL